MDKIKIFVKSNPKLFALLKQCLLYCRYAKALFQTNQYTQLEIFPYKQLIEIKQEHSHCYFGYYDKSPINGSGTMVAFLKVKDGNRQTDVADVCIYNLQTKAIKEVVGHTTTWNWQQGCMLQWVDDETISYNCYEYGSYVTKRVNVRTLECSVTCRAVYSYNKAFTKYLSLNFYRLDLYAKGYGYPYQVDSMDVDEDGIWEENIANNTSHLVLSLKTVIEHEPKGYMQCQHYINHVAYTPDETSIVFIHRWQMKGGEFVSRLLVYDLNKRMLKTLLDNGHVSHYCWKTNSILFIYATDSNGYKGYMEVNIDTKRTRVVNGLPNEDGHPSFSKDGKWILTDTYPNNRRDQFVFLFNTEEKRLYKLDKLYSPLKYFNENRCDFHPRWSIDNKWVVIDNTDAGLRSLKLYRLL